jgi:hypothetical protein
VTLPHPIAADLVERLRNGREGWSGDALCVEAETAEEAASAILQLQRRLAVVEEARDGYLKQWEKAVADRKALEAQLAAMPPKPPS